MTLEEVMKAEGIDRLPEILTDREVAAFVWIYDKLPFSWIVNLNDGTVSTARGERYVTIVELAHHHGWDG